MNDKRAGFLKVIGPGIVFASVAIGETHLALMPYAGAMYGHALLWLVVLVHVLYYPNFEYGPRYAAATGGTLVDGYRRVKAGRVLTYVLIVFMFISPPLIMSSLLGLSGSVLYAAFPAVGFPVWCTLLFLITVGIVIGGKYKVVERLSKIMVLVTVLVAILVFLISPPAPAAFFGGLSPGIPAVAGVMLVVVAILRVPTDPAISVFLSEWAVSKRQEWLSGGDGTGKQALLQALKKSLFDIRLGMVLSCIVAVVFLSIGATILNPQGIVPEGIDVSLKLSEIYTQTLGGWVFPVFVVTLFAAFWGSYLAAMDGILRLFSDLVPRIFKFDDSKTRRVSIGYLLLVTIAGLLMATVVQRPMLMVLLAVSVGLINYPLIFGLNIYCVTKLIDREFRPGTLNLIVAALGFILGVGGLVLLILVRVLKVFG